MKERRLARPIRDCFHELELQQNLLLAGYEGKKYNKIYNMWIIGRFFKQGVWSNWLQSMNICKDYSKRYYCLFRYALQQDWLQAAYKGKEYMNILDAKTIAGFVKDRPRIGLIAVSVVLQCVVSMKTSSLINVCVIDVWKDV